MDRIVYLDNAATTKIKPEVFEEMKPFFAECFGNPSAQYGFVTPVKKKIELCRRNIAELLNASEDEIYFTSGGTESDNWAIKSIAEKYKTKGKHIITSCIEHHAVLNTMKWLEENGYRITYTPVDKNGIIDLDFLQKSIDDETILISIMTANNEIGSIQPIKRIGEIARKNKIVFHTDAVQAYGHIPIDVKKMKIDMLSASGHKIYGPKGIGVLYVRNGVKIGSFIHGGSQEFGLRAGTYNTPGIVGMGKASEIAIRFMSDNEKVRDTRNLLLKKIETEIPKVFLNGDIENRLPNNLSITFEGVDSEALLTMLSENGIYASSGSACTSGDTKPSHVLKAIGLSDKDIKSTIRFSVSDDTTADDIEYAIKVLKGCVSALR